MEERGSRPGGAPSRQTPPSIPLSFLGSAFSMPVPAMSYSQRFASRQPTGEWFTAQYTVELDHGGESVMIQILFKSPGGRDRGIWSRRAHPSPFSHYTKCHRLSRNAVVLPYVYAAMPPQGMQPAQLHLLPLEFSSAATLD